MLWLQGDWHSVVLIPQATAAAAARQPVNAQCVCQTKAITMVTRVCTNRAGGHPSNQHIADRAELVPVCHLLQQGLTLVDGWLFTSCSTQRDRCTQVQRPKPMLMCLEHIQQQLAFSASRGVWLAAPHTHSNHTHGCAPAPQLPSTAQADKQPAGRPTTQQAASDGLCL